MGSRSLGLTSQGPKVSGVPSLGTLICLSRRNALKCGSSCRKIGHTGTAGE